jgi:hypothetical protein
MSRKRYFYPWLFIGMMVISWMPCTVQAAESSELAHRKVVKIKAAYASTGLT